MFFIYKVDSLKRNILIGFSYNINFFKNVNLVGLFMMVSYVIVNFDYSV